MELPLHFESVMRGNNFRPLSAKEAATKLEEGSSLTLERDPHNEYDPNAIKVIEPDSGEFIGFVAKEHAAEIAPHMDAGKKFTCNVNGFMKVGMPILEIAEVVTTTADESDAD